MPNDPLTGENVSGLDWQHVVDQVAPGPAPPTTSPMDLQPLEPTAVGPVAPRVPTGPRGTTPQTLDAEAGNVASQLAEAQQSYPNTDIEPKYDLGGTAGTSDATLLQYGADQFAQQDEKYKQDLAQPFIDRLAWIEWQKDAATARARGTDIPPFPTNLEDPASPYSRITIGLKNAAERAEFRRLLAAAQVADRFVDPDKVTGIDAVTRMRYAKGEPIADTQYRLRFNDDTGNTREMVSLDEVASSLTSEYFARSLAAVGTIGTSELYFGPRRRSFDEYIADDRPGIRWTAGAMEQAANFLPSAPGNILFDAVRHGAFRLASRGGSQKIGEVLFRAGAADVATQIPRDVLNHIDDLLYRNGGMITKEGAVAVPAAMEASEREVLRNRLRQVAEKVRETKPGFKLRLTTTTKAPVSAGATVGTWMLGGAAAQVPLAAGDVVAAIPEGSEAVKAAAAQAPLTIGMGAGFAGALGKILGPKPPTNIQRRILGDLHPPKNGVAASAYKLVLPRIGGQRAQEFDQAISRLEDATLTTRDPRAARTFNDLWREHIEFVRDAKDHPSLAAQVEERERQLLKRINLLADSAGLDVDTLHGAPISDVLYSPTMLSAIPDTSWQDRLAETLSSQPRKSLGFDPLKVRVADIGSDDPRVRALALDDALAGQKNIPIGTLTAAKDEALRTGDPKNIQIVAGDGRLYAKVEGQYIDVTESTSGLDLPADAEWSFTAEATSPVDYLLDDTGRLVPDVDGTLARDPQRQLLRRRFAPTEGEVDSPVKLFDDINKANPSTAEQFDSFAPRVAALESQLEEAHARAFDEARNLINPEEPFWRVHQLQASLLEDVYKQRTILESVKERLRSVGDSSEGVDADRLSTIDRIRALFDRARSKKSMGMAHEAPSALQKQFRARGYGHVKLDEFLSEAAKSGTLNQNEGALLREVFMDTDDSMLDSINYGVHKNRKYRGMAIYDTRQLLIKKGLSREQAQATSTFLHEYAHLASKSLLDPTEWDLVKSVWKSVGRRGRLDYFRQGLIEGNASYYAKEPEEFFVQAFAEYVITKKAQDAKLLPVLQRIYTLMTGAFERLLRRAQPSQIRQLEPLFNMMMAGERSAPSLATRTRAISYVGQPGMTRELFSALSSAERKDHMIMRLNGMLSEHKPSKFSHLGGGNYRAILAHLRSARPSYNDAGEIQNVSYARGWTPTPAERQEMSSAYEAALTEITKAQVGLMKLKKDAPLTVPELVAVIDQLSRVGPGYFTSQQFATLMKSTSPSEAWYKLERNFGDLKSNLGQADIDKANLAREVGHKALSEAGARAIVKAQEDARFTYYARFINALDKTMLTLNRMGVAFMRPHTVVGPGKSLQQPDDLFHLRGSLNKNPYWLIRGSETTGVIGMHRFVNEQTLKLDPLINLLRKDDLLNSSVVNALNSDLDNPIPAWKQKVSINKAQAMALGLNPGSRETDVHTIAKFFRGWFDPILKKTEAAIIEVDHGNIAKLKKQQEWLLGVMKTEAGIIDPNSPWTEIARVSDTTSSEDLLDLVKRLDTQHPDKGSQALRQAVNVYEKLQEGVDSLYSNIRRIEQGVLYRKNYITRIYDNFSRQMEYEIRDPHNTYGRDMAKVYTKYIQPRSGTDSRAPVANLPVIIGFYLPAMAKKIYLEPVFLRTEDMIDQLPDFYRNYINDWKKAIGGRLSPLEQTLSGQVSHDILTGGTAIPQRLAQSAKNTPEKIALRAGQVGNALTSLTQNFLMIQSMGLIHPANLAMLNALEYSWIPVQMAAQGPRAWARSHGSMLVGAAKGARDLAMDNPISNSIRGALGMSPWMSKPRMAGSGEAFHELAENNLRQIVKQAGGTGTQIGQMLQTAYKLHFWSQVMVDQHERMTAWWTFRDGAIRSGLSEGSAELWAKYQVDRVYGDLGKIGQAPSTKQGYGPIVTYLKRYLISKTDELAQDVKAALPQSPWLRAKPTANPTGPGHSVAARLADTIEGLPGDLNDYIPQQTVGGVSGRDLRQMGSDIADLPVNTARFKENPNPAFDERMRANEMFAEESGMRWEAFATKRAQKAAINKLIFGYGGWLGEMALLSKLTGISIFKMLPWIANMGVAGLQGIVDLTTLGQLALKDATDEPMSQYEAQQYKQLSESLPTRILPFGSPIRLQRRMNKIAGVAPVEGYGLGTLPGEYAQLLGTKRGLGFVFKPPPTQDEIAALRGDPVQ